MVGLLDLTKDLDDRLLIETRLSPVVLPCRHLESVAIERP